jgi:DHA1 family bicyclomycin/chloramphenicol resistance-like MFS transporter
VQPLQSAKTPRLEYILLVALIMSTGAMGTDIMLPALSVIGADLAVPNPNDVHSIVTMFFLGMAVGQLLVGPLSDAFGRRPLIFVGYTLFVLGSVVAALTESWSMMLVARMLQGVGASAPKIVAVALIRDQYEGRAMARIMSIVTAVFILVPIIAPAIGQGLIWAGGWRFTFVGLSALSISVAIWFALRLPETLAQENRCDGDRHHAARAQCDRRGSGGAQSQ